MLTQGDLRIDNLLAVAPDDRGFTFRPPPFWDSYPAIRLKIEAVDGAFRTTRAVLGTDAAAELPEPMLLLNHLPDGPRFADFSGLAAQAFRRSTQRSAEATDVWSIAESEILRTLEWLDRLRRETLHEVEARARSFHRDLLDYPSEAIRANTADILTWLDRELSWLLSKEQALRTEVEEAATVIEDWIDTVSSVEPLSVADQQQARRGLLAEMRRTFPDRIEEAMSQRGIDDAVKAALDAGDVVVMGDSGDDATLSYLASRMGMLVQENVGAILVQVPQEYQPTLDGFKGTRDRAQLFSSLRSAGFGGDVASVDALADMLAAAADRDIAVIAFDTSWGHGPEAGTRQLPIVNQYMAARLTQTLAALPEGEKNVVAVVAVPHTNAEGGLETLTGGVSVDWLPSSATLAPGSVDYDQSGNATFVYAPQR